MPDPHKLTDQEQDSQDLERAYDEKEGGKADAPWWRSVGPGLITGAADDDPSGIGTYSVAGAQYGYLLLWLIPICIPLMIAVQEMCGRVGVITGKGLAAAIKQYYPKWILYTSVFLLIGANVMNIFADLNVMAASSAMLFHGSFATWLTITAAAVMLLQIFVPYRYYVKVLKWLCLALVGYIVTAFLPGEKNNWGQIALRSFVPAWRWDFDFIMTVVGFLGTTISPYLFFWQAGQEVEQEIETGKADAPGHRVKRVTKSEMQSLKTDTIIGMVASQAVTFFIMISTAANLHNKGITNIDTAQDAAKAMLPLGPAAFWLFTLGILGTGALAIPTLAGSIGYALAETFEWPYGLYRRVSRAKWFYVVIGVSVVLGYALNFVKTISPVKALFYSAVLNGLLAPPLIVILLLICNNKKIFGKRCNGWVSNVLGWVTVVFMGVAAIIVLYGMATGKAS